MEESKKTKQNSKGTYSIKFFETIKVRSERKLKIFFLLKSSIQKAVYQ